MEFTLPETRKWDMEMKVQGQKPEPRSFHSAVSIGNKLVVVGGRGKENQHFADVHMFNCGMYIACCHIKVL